MLTRPRTIGRRNARKDTRCLRGRDWNLQIKDYVVYSKKKKNNKNSHGAYKSNKSLVLVIMRLLIIAIERTVYFMVVKYKTGKF